MNSSHLKPNPPNPTSYRRVCYFCINHVRFCDRLGIIVGNSIDLIVSIPPKLSISDFVKQIKSSSARYLNQEFAEHNYKFAWQHEYAVFSLGEKRLQWAIAYVENQEQHHATGKLVKVLEQTEPG